MNSWNHFNLNFIRLTHWFLYDSTRSTIVYQQKHFIVEMGHYTDFEIVHRLTAFCDSSMALCPNHIVGRFPRFNVWYCRMCCYKTPIVQKHQKLWISLALRAILISRKSYFSNADSFGRTRKCIFFFISLFFRKSFQSFQTFATNFLVHVSAY